MKDDRKKRGCDVSSNTRVNLVTAVSHSMSLNPYPASQEAGSENAASGPCSEHPVLLTELNWPGFGPQQLPLVQNLRMFCKKDVKGYAPLALVSSSSE